MYKVLVLTVALMIGLTTVSFGKETAMVTVAQAEEQGGMAQVRLILKKLRSSMASMKDFDELESAGMDAKDVNRMRSAMQKKIKQMTGDAVDLITAL